MKSCQLRSITFVAIATLSLSMVSQSVFADIVSFMVDPDTIDTNMDGFITGDEFQPTGSDGTLFALTPTNNLVGMPRFQLGETSGLRYGGGGGSTLAFEFFVDRNIQLESYTLANTNGFLGDPLFRILQGANVLSENNTSVAAGDTYEFNGGPLSLVAGTNYSFEVQSGGAAIQSYMGSWTYNTSNIPEPGSAGLLMAFVISLSLRRRIR